MKERYAGKFLNDNRLTKINKLTTKRKNYWQPGKINRIHPTITTTIIQGMKLQHQSKQKEKGKHEKLFVVFRKCVYERERERVKSALQLFFVKKKKLLAREKEKQKEYDFLIFRISFWQTGHIGPDKSFNYSFYLLLFFFSIVQCLENIHTFREFYWRDFELKCQIIDTPVATIVFVSHVKLTIMRQKKICL